MCLNCVLDNVTLCLEMRKPFDVLVEGRFLESSGEAGIRTLGTLAGTPVFKTETNSNESRISECSCDNSETPVGAHFGARTCLCASTNDAELQTLISAWADLPASIRQAIAAIVASQFADSQELPSGGAPY